MADQEQQQEPIWGREMEESIWDVERDIHLIRCIAGWSSGIIMKLSGIDHCSTVRPFKFEPMSQVNEVR